jgi:hypothetical protein
MTEIESILRTIGAIAVIAGTILVVLQLRVNARHARSRNAFDLTAKVIDPSFAHRRHLLCEVAEKPAALNSSASWSARRTATGSATSAARRESSSS